MPDLTPSPDLLPEEVPLLDELRGLISRSRERVAHTLNTELTRLYWGLGKRIHQNVLSAGRAEYGGQVIRRLSRRLVAEYGSGYSVTNLTHAVELARVYPQEKIIHTLCEQLSWSHLRTLIYIKDDLKREFYTEMSRLERWSVRTMKQKMDGMLYERTAISRLPEDTIRQDLQQLKEEDKLTPDLVFRDPYILSFLGMQNTYSEKDLEGAILIELQAFISELGTDFAFLARQKRIQIGGEDHRIDLLFFHRRLRRLVAIELKLGPFRAEYKGQMELYLRWLKKQVERQIW